MIVSPPPLKMTPLDVDSPTTFPRSRILPFPISRWRRRFSIVLVRFFPPRGLPEQTNSQTLSILPLLGGYLLSFCPWQRCAAFSVSRSPRTFFCSFGGKRAFPPPDSPPGRREITPPLCECSFFFREYPLHTFDDSSLG